MSEKTLREAAEAVVRVKKAADNEDALFSSQGQAMSGIEELYNYRSAVAKLEEILANDPS